MRKAILFSSLLAIPIGVLGVSISRQVKSPPATAERTPAVPAGAASGIQGIGYVEPVSETRKLVFKVNGVIAKCAARVGGSCKRDEVLFELNNQEHLAAVGVAEQDLKLAESERDQTFSGVHKYRIDAAARKVDLCQEQVRFWQKEHDRVKGLLLRNAISDSEYQKTFTELIQHVDELRQAEAERLHLEQFVRPVDRAVAEAKVVAAQAHLQLARRQYENTFLRAPFDGTVLEILKREGEGYRLFDPEPVCVFGDLSHLRVRAEIDERYVARLREGQSAIVFGRGLGSRSFAGKVESVKAIMGKKTVFARAASERKDLDVLQVMIEMDGSFSAPIGLEVDVKIFGTFD
jgi:multidrug resistance efflux pump